MLQIRYNILEGKSKSFYHGTGTHRPVPVVYGKGRNSYIMRKSRKLMAVLMSAAMMVSGLSGVSVPAKAAKKTPVRLNKTSVSVKKGRKVTLKVKKNKTVKVKSCKWTSKKKAIAVVSRKGVVTGKKVGKTTITAAVKYQIRGNKKLKTKKLNCKVTVKAAAVKASQTPAAPASSAAVTAPTQTPAASAAAPTIIPTVVPSTAPTPNPDKSKNGIRKYDDGQMDKTMTAPELMQKMGQGWNLGNTLESCGIDTSELQPSEITPTVYETGWGQPETTYKMITAVKKCGFNTVRIPVAWSNMMPDDGTYTINDAYFNRVETVMNYCFRNDMYVVLNIHYDSAWWGMFGAADSEGNAREDVRKEAWKKYEAIWTQIAERYGEYGDHLIFESANEELSDFVGGDNLGLNTKYEGVQGNLTNDEAYEVTNRINQKFVEIVRNSSDKLFCENNKYRQLLIAGFATDLDKTCDERFKMPTDTVAENGQTKLSVSIHYYSPYGWGILEDKTNADYQGSWGSQEDYDYLHSQFDKLKKFSDNGYGIIIGEYGFGNTDKKGIPAYVKEVMTYGKKIGATPVLWNNSVFDRYDGVICFKDFAQMLEEVTGATNVPLEEGAVDTGTMQVEKLSDADVAKMKVVASWEGIWSRTNNKGITADGKPDLSLGEVGNFETTSCSDGLTVQSNKWFWQLFLTYDWSKLKKPAIRVTMASDELSSKADFQFAYCKGKDINATHFDTMDHAEYNEAVLALSAEKLAGVKNWIEFSSPTEGASITKIEILDLAE